MERRGRNKACWALGAVLAGCSGDAAEPAVPASDSSSSDAEPASRITSAGETTTDGTSDTSGELSEGSSESSTTGESADGSWVGIAPGKTLDAELVDSLAIARSQADAQRRVVLRLEASELPELRDGDRLLAAAEIQVTTRCDVGQTAPGCDYDPQIAAQLVLVDDGDDAVALSPVQTLTCTRSEHHCMFVIRPVDATLVLDDTLHGCVAAQDCRIEAVMWAWDEQARAGGVDVVLVGENEGDYLANQMIGGDKARLMAVRERGELGDDVESSETSASDTMNVPTDASATLVYSHPLVGVVAGEQFLVEAKIVTGVSSRARVSSMMFVTTDPMGTEGGLEAIAPAQIGEHNGINCTAGTSPCTTRKVAVFRADEDIAGPVYVNVFVKSAVPGGGSANVTVRREQGWIRATRYAAALAE